MILVKEIGKCEGFGVQNSGGFISPGRMGMYVPDPGQGLSQDLESGCLKLAIEELLGIQIFEGYH